GDHFLALFGRHGHGFFGDDVVAGVEGVDDGGSVDAVGRADVDGVGLHFLQHFLPVGERGRDAVGVAHPFEAIGFDIDAGDDLGVGEVLEGAEVQVGNAAAADDG